MSNKNITDRKLYLNNLKNDLYLNDNAAVTSEMIYRAKHIESLSKALLSANVNRDNVLGINMHIELKKNPIIKKYLQDLFFFDMEKLKPNGSTKILVADANLFNYCKAHKLDSKDDTSYGLLKSDFSKVSNHITACISYFQVENIKEYDEYNKPLCRTWIRILPSKQYLDYLNKIKFISHEKYIK